MPDRTDALETALRTAASRVEFPPTPPIAPTVIARLRADALRAHRPPLPGVALWSRRRVVVAVALGLLLLGGAAVAARLAIGAVGFEVVRTLAPSAPPEAPAAFGHEVSLRDAVRATGMKPGWPPSLGTPDDAYVVRPPGPGNGLVLAWRDVAGYARIPDTPWDVVLFELPGEEDVATKFTLADSIEPARVHGRRAFWISGPHDLALQGASGGALVRVSGNVLIWQRSPAVTYRLESMLPRREAIALAETLP